MTKSTAFSFLSPMLILMCACSSVPQKQAVNATRTLIINADDLGYSQEINDAITRCYDQGLVTSTTAYVNFPDSLSLIQDAHARYPDLPIGIHLNITLGKPVLPPEEVPTMVNPKTGNFWNEDQILSHIADMSYEEVQKEIHAQIARFLSSGVPLDHIDYHNHLLALYTPFHQIVRDEAASLDIPVRNPVPISSYSMISVPSGGGNTAAISKMIVYGMLHPFKAFPMMKKVGVTAFIRQEELTREAGIRTPDWFVDVFYENATPEIFRSILEQLPEGTSEIMCHPGSSENECRILTDPAMKQILQEQNIQLRTFTAL